MVRTCDIHSFSQVVSLRYPSLNNYSYLCNYFPLKDYYKILSIDSTANAEDIKKAYRKLALKYHPDINKSAMANDNFMLINEAYQVLSNEQTRKRYDINLKYGLETPELIIKHDKYREGDGKKYGTAYKYPKQPPRASKQEGRHEIGRAHV